MQSAICLSRLPACLLKCLKRSCLLEHCYFVLLSRWKAEKALELFGKIRDAGFEPNLVTLIVFISIYARLMDLERGKEIHRELIKKGLVLDGFLGPVLAKMWLYRDG